MNLQVEIIKYAVTYANIANLEKYILILIFQNQNRSKLEEI